MPDQAVKLKNQAELKKAQERAERDEKLLAEKEWELAHMTQKMVASRPWCGTLFSACCGNRSPPMQGKTNPSFCNDGDDCFVRASWTGLGGISSSSLVKIG